MAIIIALMLVVVSYAYIKIQYDSKKEKVNTWKEIIDIKMSVSITLFIVTIFYALYAIIYS